MNFMNIIEVCESIVKDAANKTTPEAAFEKLLKQTSSQQLSKLEAAMERVKSNRSKQGLSVVLAEMLMTEHIDYIKECFVNVEKARSLVHSTMLFAYRAKHGSCTSYVQFEADVKREITAAAVRAALAAQPPRGILGGRWM